jgi:anti-sigma-K factor RskA
VTEPGKAQVLKSADGLVVRVDARGLPPSAGFHEVWLLDTDATKLVSLGALPSGSVGTFTIPPGVTVTDFPVVDISLEPYDGNPGHSHDSLLRGVLQA